MSDVEELQCSKVENGIECRDKCINGVVNLKLCDCHKRNPRFPNLTIFRLVSILIENCSLIIKLDFLKASSDPSHFIFEINVGKSRIRHTTTLKLNDEFLDRVKFD